MSETRDDLREALDDLCDRLDRQNTVTAPQACADTMDEARVAILSLRAGLDALVEANAALATGEWTDVRQLEAEAQVSALQAEVEEARQDAREAGHNGGHLLHQLDQAKVEIRRLSAEVERLQKVEGEREKALSDPVRVHASMLAGSIAKPSIANVVHLYGAEALWAALGPRAHEEPLVCPRCGIERSYLPACMQPGCPTLLDQMPSDNPLTETKEGSEHV